MGNTILVCLWERNYHSVPCKRPPPIFGDPTVCVLYTLYVQMASPCKRPPSTLGLRIPLQYKYRSLTCMCHNVRVGEHNNVLLTASNCAKKLDQHGATSIYIQSLPTLWCGRHVQKWLNRAHTQQQFPYPSPISVAFPHILQSELRQWIKLC